MTRFSGTVNTFERDLALYETSKPFKPVVTPPHIRKLLQNMKERAMKREARKPFTFSSDEDSADDSRACSLFIFWKFLVPEKQLSSDKTMRFPVDSFVDHHSFSQVSSASLNDSQNISETKTTGIIRYNGYSPTKLAGSLLSVVENAVNPPKQRKSNIIPMQAVKPRTSSSENKAKERRRASRRKTMAPKEPPPEVENRGFEWPKLPRNQSPSRTLVNPMLRPPTPMSASPTSTSPVPNRSPSRPYKPLGLADKSNSPLAQKEYAKHAQTLNSLISRNLPGRSLLPLDMSVTSPVPTSRRRVSFRRRLFHKKSFDMSVTMDQTEQATAEPSDLDTRSLGLDREDFDLNSVDMTVSPLASGKVRVDQLAAPEIRMSETPSSARPLVRTRQSSLTHQRTRLLKRANSQLSPTPETPPKTKRQKSSPSCLVEETPGVASPPARRRSRRTSALQAKTPSLRLRKSNIFKEPIVPESDPEDLSAAPSGSGVSATFGSPTFTSTQKPKKSPKASSKISASQKTKKPRDSLDEFQLMEAGRPRIRGTRRLSTSTEFRLLFTGFDKNEQALLKGLLKSSSLANYRVLEKMAKNCTHLIVPEKVKRTINLLYGMVFGALIVPVRWLSASIEEGAWQPTDHCAVNVPPVLKLSSLFAKCGTIGVLHDPKIGGPPRKDLAALVQYAGGKVTHSAKNATIVVGAERTPIVSLSPTWVLDSIERGAVQPHSLYAIITQ